MEPYQADLKEVAKNNDDFRRVLFAGTHSSAVAGSRLRRATGLPFPLGHGTTSETPESRPLGFSPSTHHQSIPPERSITPRRMRLPVKQRRPSPARWLG
jgi:hypothetical protein